MSDPLYIRVILLREPVDEKSYVSRLPAVRFLQSHRALTLHRPVTFFVGENGTGKSTLIEAIAVAYGFNPEGGSRNFQFHTRDSHSDLWEHLTLAKGAYPKDGFFLRAESFYNLASNIDDIDTDDPGLIDAYGGVSLHRQSHGESFLALVQNRFFGNGLYILDEPEAALSPNRQLTLLAEIDRLVRADSQLIIATHSPLLMAYPQAEIFAFSADGISPIAYTDTEHYRVTRAFLNNPEKMLKYLLDN